MIITPKKLSFQGNQQAVCLGSEGSPGSLPLCLPCSHLQTPPPRSQPELRRGLQLLVSLSSLFSSCNRGIPMFTQTASWCVKGFSLYCYLFICIFTCFLTFFSCSRLLPTTIVNLELLHKPQGQCSQQPSLPITLRSREIWWGAINSDFLRSIQGEPGLWCLIDKNVVANGFIPRCLTNAIKVSLAMS